MPLIEGGGQRFTDAAPSPASSSQPLWKWVIAVAALALVSLCTGSVNLYPSQGGAIRDALGVSNGVSTFMLTGGVMLMYLTLPCGIFMDRFGPNLTLLIAVAIVLVTYIILPFVGGVPALFVILYLLMAFGNSSIFIVCLQVVLARAPAKIKGVSVSVVSAMLSMSFGMFLEIFKSGTKGAVACRGPGCVFSGFLMVAIVTIVLMGVGAPVAYLFYRSFEQGPDPVKKKSWAIWRRPDLYILLVGMFLTVFDGMLVVGAGEPVWQRYGSRYPEGAGTYGIAFSVTNCISTIALSAILDFILNKVQGKRSRWFSFFWLVMGVIPLVVGIIYRSTDNETLFAAFMSMMGIPFGFGLTHIPAMVSDCFGNEKYGFAFGIVQVGSIIASATTLPIIQATTAAGIQAAFIVAAVMHVLVGLLVLFFVKSMAENPGVEQPEMAPSTQTTSSKQINI